MNAAPQSKQRRPTPQQIPIDDLVVGELHSAIPLDVDRARVRTAAQALLDTLDPKSAVEIAP